MNANVLSKARESEEKFPELLNSLVGRFRDLHPPQIVTILSNYGLQRMVTDAGVSEQSLVDIGQHHVELEQAIALTLPQDEWGRRTVTPDVIQAVIDEIVELADAYQIMRLSRLEKERDQQQQAVLSLQGRLRANTQCVRNWGYRTAMVDVSTELYGPLDSGLHSYYGFSATDLIEVINAIMTIIEERANNRWTTMKGVFRSRNVRQLVHRYFAQFPDVDGDPEEFLGNLPKDVSLNGVKSFLMAHADTKLFQLFLFDCDSIAEVSGRSIEVVRRVLDIISMRPGDLGEESVNDFFLDNPIWTKPGIIFNTKCMFPMPQAILSHIHAIMRRLAKQANLNDKLHQQRATFLENKIGATIQRIFPTENFSLNAKWNYEGTRYETDLVGQVDRVVLIVEAKSGALTVQGLRGAPGRVKRHVHDLVVGPAEQSARLEQLISQAKSGKTAAIETISSLGLEPDKVDTVIRISVTLDDFSMMAIAERELKAAGWVPPELRLAPTLNITDLVCVAEILSEPVYFLHYFAERGRIQNIIELISDEMDLLGFYLETGFNVDERKLEGSPLVTTGLSQRVDHFYNSADAGVEVKKPRPKIHRTLERIVLQIQSRHREGWTTKALDLLRIGNLEEQRAVYRKIEKLRKRVPRTFRDPKHICSLVVLPPAHRDGFVLFYVYPDAIAERRYEVVEQLAEAQFAVQDHSRCVVVGKKIEDWDNPYTFVAVCKRPV